MDVPAQGQPNASPVQLPSVADALTSAATQSREQILYPDDQPPTDAEPPPATKPQAKAHEQTEGKDKLGDQVQPSPAADEFKLKMPEGVALDQELLSSAAPVLKEIGLSGDQAQRLVPLVSQVQQRFHETQLDQLSALKKAWAKEAQSDREMGGNNWKETMRLAGVALQAGGSAASLREAQELLNESGLGNHPAMIRLFRNMGAEIQRLRSKEKGIGGGSWQEANRRHQQSVYPNDAPRS